MAEIDELVGEIPDHDLREAISRAVAKLRSTRSFGLVFEDHIPETVALPGLPIETGSLVQRRADYNEGLKYRVVESANGKATIKPISGGDQEIVGIDDLLAIRRFGEPIYPGLKHVDSIWRGDDSAQHHVVINGENFHAVQILGLTHEQSVDVLYLDPPYNTGARDWKYNNRIVGDDDSYSDSKWLSMMERRLEKAKGLMKPDGVVIVTIDEHEVHPLGILLKQVFRNAYHQMVTIVNNPKGVTQDRFSRVEEYAHFVFLGRSGVESRPDDLLTWGADQAGEPGEAPRWKGLLRSGTNALPSDRPNMVYPIAIDPDSGRIMGAGATLKERQESGEIRMADYDSIEPDRDLEIDGYPVAWPIRKNGRLGNWGLGRETFLELADGGMARVGRFDGKRGTWALSYLGAQLREQLVAGLLEIVDADSLTGVIDVRYVDIRDRRIKTVWHRSSHDAGTGGADLVSELLGSRRFDFPKSVYAVRDTLDALTASKPDAVIVDFFAGSGTTLHATMLLNAEDDGRRQCILVTNNEVDEKTAAELVADGYWPGDAEYEQHGIFQDVTHPRCVAALRGRRSDGSILNGKYRGGRALSEGFAESIDFFSIEYLDPDDVELHRQYSAIAPMLWMKAGGIGEWRASQEERRWSISESAPFAVLFDEAHFSDFLSVVVDAPHLTHIFLVTDSPAAFAEMRSRLPSFECSMLYTDYLRNFEITMGGGA
ncbi:site-specific DNA-methyltransferase [Candidatus Bipolaricaulota bacterium]|nr:site-specific DNA-methyltransferase [Candidatus Bipolaricaulota bacterium]